MPKVFDHSIYHLLLLARYPTYFIFSGPFPLISSAPKLSYKVEKINETELLDFKCDFGEFDNHTLAMYTVSWLKGTSSAPFKTVVFSGTVQKEVHATLPELHAHGFRLGDTVSIAYLPLESEKFIHYL